MEPLAEPRQRRLGPVPDLSFERSDLMSPDFAWHQTASLEILVAVQLTRDDDHVRGPAEHQ